MKKAILSVVTICAVAVLLVGQDSTTAPVTESASKSASSKSSASKSAEANPNAKYKIAMKYQPGQKYEVVFNHKMNQVVTVGGSTTKAQGSFAMKLYMDVQKAGVNGMTPVTISVGRCAQKMQYDGREDGFDSDDPDFGKGKGASVVGLMSRRYPGVIGKDGLIGDGADGMRDRNELIYRLLNLPLSYAGGEFSDIGEVWDGVNAEPFSMFARLLVGDGSDGDGQSPSEKFSLTLKEIIDSPAGKIAVIDIKGVLMVSKEEHKRFGSIRFNMEKQIVEAIVIETVAKDSVGEKFRTVDEVLVKPIDEIPVHRLLQPVSQPTSAAASSQPASAKSATSKSAASKATSNPNAKYKIAMKYQPGMKYEIVIKHEQQNTFSMNGQQSQMKMDASFKYYIDAGQPNADGQTPIRMAIRRITMKMQSPNGKDEDFDTDDPDSGKQEVADKMMAIVSCGYTFYLDKEGNVEKIDGAEEMYDKAMENDPKGTSRRDKDMKEVNSMLTMIFNAPLSFAIGEFSDVGSTWEGVNDKAFAIFDGTDSTSEDMTLKLAEIVDSPNGKIAVIDMESLVDSHGRTVPRTGQIKFNLDKKMIEYIRLESSQEDGQTKNQEKTEIEVRIVKEIPPAKAATSQPASASADSQPAK